MRIMSHINGCDAPEIRLGLEELWGCQDIEHKITYPIHDK